MDVHPSSNPLLYYRSEFAGGEGSSERITSTNTLSIPTENNMKEQTRCTDQIRWTTLGLCFCSLIGKGKTIVS